MEAEYDPNDYAEMTQEEADEEAEEQAEKEMIRVPAYNRVKTSNRHGLKTNAPLDPFRDRGRVVIDIVSHMKRRKMTSRRGPKRGTVNVSALERMTGISHMTIWKMIRMPESVQYISLDVLARLCYALDCDIGDILKYRKDIRTYPTAKERGE